MSQTFSVNGKEYILSSTLAASSGYSSDYIGKLAREEKIIGARIGRQWFIEPESLKVFLHKTAIEKEIRKDELSKERKLTHAATQSEKSSTPKVRLVSPSALAETFIIVLCGLFVGGLSWVITAEHIGIQEISKAGVANLQLVVESISPTKNIITKGIEPQSSVAASTESVTPSSSRAETVREVFTVLPIFPPREMDVAHMTTSSTSATSPIRIVDLLELSDEVIVEVDQQGNQFIKPIFKKSATNTVRFLLVPTSPGSEN